MSSQVNVVLAERYRGAGRSQLVDALLARHEDAIDSRDTDRPLARFVGVVLTADTDDLTRLAGPYRSVLVEPIG